MRLEFMRRMQSTRMGLRGNVDLLGSRSERYNIWQASFSLEMSRRIPQ